MPSGETRKFYKLKLILRLLSASDKILFKNAHLKIFRKYFLTFMLLDDLKNRWFKKNHFSKF